jgi:hypothetical protein
METKLIASAGSLEQIHRAIVKFFYGSNVTLEQVSENEWKVYTGKGLVNGARVKLLKKRYRFEMVY